MSVSIDYKQGVLNNLHVHDVASVEFMELSDGFVQRWVTTDGILVNIYMSAETFAALDSSFREVKGGAV